LVEFYRLSCASASQFLAPAKKWLKEWSVSRPIRPRHPVSVVEVLLHCSSGDSDNPFVPYFLLPVFFSHPPSTLTPSGIRVLLTQSFIFYEDIFFLKKLLFHFPLPLGSEYDFLKPIQKGHVWTKIKYKTELEFWTYRVIL